MTQIFPPPRLSDLDRRSAGALLSAARACNRGFICLFLGSGVSASAGLPTWQELLARICAAFFEHWLLEPHLVGRTPSPPRDLSIAFWEAFEWDGEARALASEFAKGNPLLVAQQIKNCVRPADWRYLVNKVLYGVDGQPHESQLLDALARLCGGPTAVGAVVNFNFDSLFEEHLDTAGVEYGVVWSPDVGTRPPHLPVLHPHGFLKRGGGPVTPLVLAEGDYFDYSRAPHAWPDATLIGYLTGLPCLFVGHSMTDPHVRRILRLTSAVSAHRHFAFLPRLEGAERLEMFQALFDVDLARLGVSVIRYPLRTDSDGTTGSHSRLPELLDALRIAAGDAKLMWTEEPK